MGIGQREIPKRKRAAPRIRRQNLIVLLVLAVSIAGAASAWLGLKAVAIKSELEATVGLAAQVKSQIVAGQPDQASTSLAQLQIHTTAAREAADDPIWKLASTLPIVGSNFSAVSEVARSADDVAVLGLKPLVRVFDSLNWDNLMPSTLDSNLEPLRSASPSVTSAAYAVRTSAERLERIDSSQLLPQVAEQLDAAKNELRSATGALDASANAAELLPSMLGGDAPRNYLLMIQNNAEARASGGIPGALAVLSADKGKLNLGAQSSASEVGVMDPILPVDQEQQTIYSGRIGKFLQDVNLTPDFPTAAATAQAMWERKTGQRLDGVISIDPVALSYVLNATGPVQVLNPTVKTLAGEGLPLELNGENVVRTLLSDVYGKIEQPSLQDAYFAGVAQEVFSALLSGKGDAKGLVDGLARGTAEGRLLVWSAQTSEQDVIAKYPLSGSIEGASVSPAQFGVYFNDGTGAKMDYYVKRTVQLLKECSRDGYEQTTVRVTSTNTAPDDAATSLPSYVTGAGNFGIPPGSVQTNIVAYGPVQANVEMVNINGVKTDFAPYLHGNRPVGVLAVRLAPGESRSVDFTFGKIVQHTEPNLVVTPTVQDVKDVILPTKNTQCG